MNHNLPMWAHKILRCLAEVVMPHDENFKLDLTDEAIEFVDRYVGYFPVYLRKLFPLGLVLLEFGPILYMRKLQRFTGMSFEEREAYVASWVDSKNAMRRDLIKGVKGLVMVSFYSNPQVMERIGYDIEPHIAAALSRGY